MEGFESNFWLRSTGMMQDDLLRCYDFLMIELCVHCYGDIFRYTLHIKWLVNLFIDDIYPGVSSDGPFELLDNHTDNKDISYPDE